MRGAEERRGGSSDWKKGVGCSQFCCLDMLSCAVLLALFDGPCLYLLLVVCSFSCRGRAGLEHLVPNEFGSSR